MPHRLRTDLAQNWVIESYSNLYVSDHSNTKGYVECYPELHTARSAPETVQTDSTKGQRTHKYDLEKGECGE